MCAQLLLALPLSICRTSPQDKEALTVGVGGPEDNAASNSLNLNPRIPDPNSYRWGGWPREQRRHQQRRSEQSPSAGWGKGGSWRRKSQREGELEHAGVSVQCAFVPLRVGPRYQHTHARVTVSALRWRAASRTWLTEPGVATNFVPRACPNAPWVLSRCAAANSVFASA